MAHRRGKAKTTWLILKCNLTSRTTCGVQNIRRGVHNVYGAEKMGPGFWVLNVVLRNDIHYKRAGIAQSARRLVTGWTVRGSNAVGVGECLDFRHQSSPALGPTQIPVQQAPAHFPGGKAVGGWRWPPKPFSAEVKESVELYLYNPLGP